MQETSLEFLRLCRATVDDLQALKVHDSERHLIAPSPEWIAQVAFLDEAVSFGLFVGRRAVGLITLVDPRLVEDKKERAHFQQDCLYVWRVMVERTQRERGYGTEAIEFARNYAGLVGLKGVSLTTMDKEVGNALPFYEKLGFHPTGRRLDGEIELVWRG